MLRAVEYAQGLTAMALERYDRESRNRSPLRPFSNLRVRGLNELRKAIGIGESPIEASHDGRGSWHAPTPQSNNSSSHLKLQANTAREACLDCLRLSAEDGIPPTRK